MTFPTLTVAAFCLSFSAGVTDAAVLTFTGVATNNGDAIPQTYGDIPGVLDVVYDGAASGPNIADLNYWDTGYSGLVDVAFGYRFTPDIAEIFFDAAPGYLVTLNGFDLGSWQGVDRLTQWSVLTGDGTILAESGAIVVGNSPLSVLAGLSSDNGLRLQWGPENYYVAIDNIDFTVDGFVPPVPLPAAAWTLFAGLAMLAGLRTAGKRRQHHHSVPGGRARQDQSSGRLRS